MGASRSRSRLLAGTADLLAPAREWCRNLAAATARPTSEEEDFGFEVIGESSGTGSAISYSWILTPRTPLHTGCRKLLRACIKLRLLRVLRRRYSRLGSWQNLNTDEKSPPSEAWKRVASLRGRTTNLLSKLKTADLFGHVPSKGGKLAFKARGAR